MNRNKLLDDFFSPIIPSRFYKKRIGYTYGNWKVKREFSGFGLYYKNKLCSFRYSDLFWILKGFENLINENLINENLAYEIVSLDRFMDVYNEKQKIQMRLFNDETEQTISCFKKDC